MSKQQQVSPVTALPQMSLPVNARGTHAACHSMSYIEQHRRGHCAMHAMQYLGATPLQVASYIHRVDSIWSMLSTLHTFTELTAYSR